MLKVIDVSKSYGNREILHNVSIEFRSGESTALIGESGSGKTTLAKIIVGLEKADKGSIVYNNKLQDLKHRSFEDCTKIQYVFQDPYSVLEDNYTIRQTMNETINICKRHKHKYLDIETVLRYVDESLLQYIDKEVLVLSGGQRQKMCIARALIVNPEVIIIDEGTSMLDYKASKEINSLLDRIKSEKNVCVISILHEIDFDNDNWDNVAVFYNGKLVEYKKFKDFSKLCTEEYSKRLVEAFKYFKGEN